mmetsp:Transcript_34722/g.64632  ORF Transcript_34722/g.64632 Transcript_34722/m.64632 type:complete len:203 (-) Transcript_34722:79-687(-)
MDCKMEATSLVAYSLWLLPDSGVQQEKLDSLVNEMADRFNSSRFDFHVTLLGGIKSSDLDEMKSTVARVASMLQPFDISFGDDSIAVFDTWNQNVLLLAAESAELKAANLAARRAFLDPLAQESAFADPSGRPHGSLLYGPHSMEVREAAVSWVREEAAWILQPWSFRATRVVLYETQTPAEKRWEGVPTWKRVAEFPLGPA